MLTHLSALLVASLQLAPQQGTTLPPSPVDRIEVSPRPREITAGDSVRLTARALDAQGKPVPGATIRYALRSGWGEAAIDSTGMLVASSVGKPIVTIGLPTELATSIPVESIAASPQPLRSA